jgi:3'-phosphoadenosine 5'-phosphosulfate sulfotransferase (PAPS reductase)/FAD synthetase
MTQLSLITEPVRPLAEIVWQARQILTDAIEEHEPVAIYLALSGGNDSRTVAHLALPILAEHPRFRGAALVDTGIALHEAHEDVRAFTRWLGNVSLVEVATPDRYEDVVLEYGFPGPAQHPRMYQRLKERAFRRLTAMAKEGEKRSARVMLVSGVRKYESKRRVKLSAPVTHDDARTWVNPLFWWTTPERDAYRLTTRIPENPITPFLCGSSGDCLDGSMADPNGEEEHEAIRQFFPYMGRRLDTLAKLCRERGVWDRYGSKPPPEKAPPPCPGDEDLVLFACAGCELRHAGGSAEE